MAVQQDRREQAVRLMTYCAELLNPMEPSVARALLSLVDKLDPEVTPSHVGATTEPPMRKSEYDIGHALGREDRLKRRPRLHGKALDFYGPNWREGYVSGYSADADALADATGAAA